MLDTEEFEGRVDWTSVGTDFSTVEIGKVAFILNEETQEYLAMEVWDERGNLVNHATFWTGSYNFPTKKVEVKIPELHEIIGLQANTKHESSLQNLGLRTWRPNPEAPPVQVGEFFQNRFRKTAIWGHTDLV